MGLPKTYRVVARLGWVSDTGDLTGSLTEGRMPSSLSIPVGEQLQTPPAYSAIKVGGERLYKKARRGEQVEVPARPITVYRADLLSSSDERAEFELEVSSGTYVRSLIADLGDAYCEELRRTAIGPFSVADAGTEVPLGEALEFLPAFELTDEQARLVGHGVAISGQGGEAVRLLHEDRLVAVARGEGDQLKPFLVFN